MNSLLNKIAEESVKEFLKYLGAAAIVQVVVQTSSHVGDLLGSLLTGKGGGSDKPQGQPGGFIVELPDDGEAGPAAGSTHIHFAPSIYIVNDSQTEEYTKTSTKTDKSQKNKSSHSNNGYEAQEDEDDDGVVNCNGCDRRLGVPLCDECNADEEE